MKLVQIHSTRPKLKHLSHLQYIQHRIVKNFQSKVNLKMDHFNIYVFANGNTYNLFSMVI